MTHDKVKGAAGGWEDGRMEGWEDGGMGGWEGGGKDGLKESTSPGFTDATVSQVPFFGLNVTTNPETSEINFSVVE